MARNDRMARRALPSPPAAGVPKEDVAPAVRVEVADRSDAPRGVSRERRAGCAFRDDAPAFHRVEPPVAADVAEQHVVAPVAVEVADARHAPVEAPRQVRPAGLLRDRAPAVHRVVRPGSVEAAQQQVVAAVVVEVADAGDAPLGTSGQVCPAPARVGHGTAAEGVVRPRPVGAPQQHVVGAVAVEVSACGPVPPGFPGHRKSSRRAESGSGVGAPRAVLVADDRRVQPRAVEVEQLRTSRRGSGRHEDERRASRTTPAAGRNGPTRRTRRGFGFEGGRRPAHGQAPGVIGPTQH